MASSDHLTNNGRRGDHAPGFRAIRWNIDWILRPVFGIVLAIIAIGAAFEPPKILAGLIVLLFILAAREWHRMVAPAALEPRKLQIMTAVTVVSVAAALTVMLMGAPLFSPLPLLAGAIAVLLVGRDDNPVWQCAGVLYLGIPALALVALRTFPMHGAHIVGGLFFLVWATDTGALVWGGLIGGPRVAPKLSPGKTWAGTIGGSLTAAVIYSCFVALIGGPMLESAAFALVFSVTAHGGDLLESFVKRRFGRKDSGAAIPGHGGVLDRIDSILAASVAMAILVFGFHLNPLFWGLL
jgi:phosphatidate cytidylyltransferase